MKKSVAGIEISQFGCCLTKVSSSLRRMELFLGWVSVNDSNPFSLGSPSTKIILRWNSIRWFERSFLGMLKNRDFQGKQENIVGRRRGGEDKCG